MLYNSQVQNLDWSWRTWTWFMENKNQTFKIKKNPNEIVAHWIKVCVDVIVLQLMLIIGLAHALVVFRVVAAPLMSESKWEFLKDNANLVSVFLGAVLHYITIQIMTRVCIPGSSSLSVGRMNRKSMFRLTSLKYYPGDQGTPLIGHCCTLQHLPAC